MRKTKNKKKIWIDVSFDRFFMNYNKFLEIESTLRGSFNILSIRKTGSLSSGESLVWGKVKFRTSEERTAFLLMIGKDRMLEKYTSYSQK